MDLPKESLSYLGCAPSTVGRIDCSKYETAVDFGKYKVDGYILVKTEKGS
jgi:hypothetical protein